MSWRLRLTAFAAVALLVLAGTVGYLVKAHSDRQDSIRSAPAEATVALAAVAARPRIVFRDNARAHYGVLAMVPLSDPAGPRALTTTSCDRLYAGPTDTLCVALDRLTISYEASILDVDRRRVQELSLGGIPSRARLSADGSLAATTAFANIGDSYTTTGFSTRTYITQTAADGAKAGRSLSLEDFSLIHEGKQIRPVDRNYWGVTFAADDNLFYATVAFGGHTWLARGDLRARTITTLRSDAECPSLSPDGTHVVYKKRDGMAAGHWRLTSLDLATGVETALAETRSVDDQAEWLDDSHVLYALPGSGGDPDISDVWVVPADGSGSPRVLIPQASSPSVLR
jgi:hypothetical protein